MVVKKNSFLLEFLSRYTASHHFSVKFKREHTMENRENNQQFERQNLTYRGFNRQKNPYSLRNILGLPDLNDTDNNCVTMHNLRVENEVYHINQRMGSAEHRQGESAYKIKSAKGIDSKYGF